MKFATATELNQNTHEVLSNVIENSEDVIITKNGKPVAMIIPTNGEDLEELILIKHLGLDKATTKKELAQSKNLKDVIKTLKSKK